MNQKEVKRLLAKHNRPAEKQVVRNYTASSPELLQRAVDMVRTGMNHNAVCRELRIDVNDFLALPIGTAKGFRPSTKQHLTVNEIKRRIRKVDELIESGVSFNNALNRMNIHNVIYYGPHGVGVRKERRSKKKVTWEKLEPVAKRVFAYGLKAFSIRISASCGNLSMVCRGLAPCSESYYNRIIKGLESHSDN